jgi:hypothetical protein
LRFVLGGLATIVAGLIAEHWGPVVGGLFLAFPAIFCATATLIEKHERERKQTVALLAIVAGLTPPDWMQRCRSWQSRPFHICNCRLVVSPNYGLAALAIAAVTWLLVSIASWRLRRDLRHTR